MLSELLGKLIDGHALTPAERARARSELRELDGVIARVNGVLGNSRNNAKLSDVVVDGSLYVDGRLVAAGRNVEVDETGITIGTEGGLAYLNFTERPTSGIAGGSITGLEASGDYQLQLYAQDNGAYPASYNATVLQLTSQDGATEIVFLLSDDSGGSVAPLLSITKAGTVTLGGAIAALNVGTATGAGAGDIHASADVRLTTNGEALEMVRATGSAVIEVLKILSTTDILALTVPNANDAAALRVLNSGGATVLELTGAGGLRLVDGITAPATAAGFAQLYVDTADGDLKVKFGDGTTKVLAADT